MDEPILYTLYNDKDFGNVDKLSLFQRLYIALLNDDKPAFMSLIKDPGFGELRAAFTVTAIFAWDSLEIALAVLNGETTGLIDPEDVLKDGLTPLHLAVIRCAPRLTKYFLQKGGILDAVCDNEKFKLKNATPIGCCTHLIEPSKIKTLFNLLWWLCFHERARIEIIRLFVQSGQHTWAREAFLNYAQNGEMRKLAALFLAAPQLFLPLLSKLNNKLNFLELETRIKNKLSLLLDVFALVGHKLAAYIRLEGFAPKSCTDEEIEQTKLEVESFVREAAIKKHGDHYVDYYLRFFEADRQDYYVNDDGKQNSDDYIDADEEWDDLTSLLEGKNIYNFLPYMLQRTGFKRREIHRLIPTLEGQNPVRAGILTRAIEVSALHFREVESYFFREVEEPVAENDVNVAAEKPAGQEENVDAEKEATLNKAEEDPEEKGYVRLSIGEVEEPVAENEVNVAAEKPAGEDKIVDAEKEATVNKAEEDLEEKQFTLEESEMILEEKRKALLSLSEQKKGEERKIDVKEFQSMMQLVSKKKNDEVFIKLDSGKDKRRDAAEREKKSKKSVSINEFLKPVEGETHYRPGGRGRGRGRGDRGGYARNNGSAPVIEDKSQFPPLGLRRPVASR